MPEKTCVITGASRGIGLAVAVRFARAGYNIVATARSEDGLKSAAAEIEAAGGACHAVAADVGKRADCERLIGEASNAFGRIDVLVNNAGYAPLANIDEFDPGDFDQALAANVAGVFHLTQLVWPVMKTQGGGTIINISSVASFDPFPGFAVYGGCKAWVNVFTKSVATQGRAANIRVFAVAPGAVETQMLRGVLPDLPADKTLAPDDIAAVVENLCDDRFKHSVGQTIVVKKE